MKSWLNWSLLVALVAVVCLPLTPLAAWDQGVAPAPAEEQATFKVEVYEAPGGISAGARAVSRFRSVSSESFSSCSGSLQVAETAVSCSGIIQSDELETSCSGSTSSRSANVRSRSVIRESNRVKQKRHSRANEFCDGPVESASTGYTRTRSKEKVKTSGATAPPVYVGVTAVK